MSISSDFFEEALAERVRWVEHHMRQLDPRDLCHVSMVEFLHRPLYCELHCRGIKLGSFEIVCQTTREATWPSAS